jgi:hypothetical protein
MSMRVAAVGSREDSDTYVAALTTSADMSGLTEVVTRWSAAKPAVTSCEEIVTLPELTGESRDTGLVACMCQSLNPNVRATAGLFFRL